MKIVYLVFVIVLSGVIVAMSVCEPNILAKNKFLDGFINQEILSKRDRK
jgi:hypothetical protein